MLAGHGLAVGYAPHPALLENLELVAEPGVFIGVMGRNGTGKSTLLRTLAGLQAPLAGAVEIAGDRMEALSAWERARRVGVVLTDRVSAPGLRVEDVVALGRAPFTDWHGGLAQEDHSAVQRALSELGIEGWRGQFIDELSDGQRQRVMIARAVAQSPRVMILDEITAFLDLPGRVETMLLLRRYARQTGAVVLLSSHDLELCLQLVDRIWLIPGRGEMLSGLPAELVASGAIARAFDSDEVRFSSELQRFQVAEAD